MRRLSRPTGRERPAQSLLELHSYSGPDAASSSTGSADSTRPQLPTPHAPAGTVRRAFRQIPVAPAVTAEALAATARCAARKSAKPRAPTAQTAAVTRSSEDDSSPAHCDRRNRERTRQTARGFAACLRWPPEESPDSRLIESRHW